MNKTTLNDYELLGPNVEGLNIAILYKKSSKPMCIWEGDMCDGEKHGMGVATRFRFFPMNRMQTQTYGNYVHGMTSGDSLTGFFIFRRETWDWEDCMTCETTTRKPGVKYCFNPIVPHANLSESHKALMKMSKERAHMARDFINQPWTPQRNDFGIYKEAQQVIWTVLLCGKRLQNAQSSKHSPGRLAPLPLEIWVTILSIVFDRLYDEQTISFYNDLKKEMREIVTEDDNEINNIVQTIPKNERKRYNSNPYAIAVAVFMASALVAYIFPWSLS
eukprot:m.3299 g.3299  ORF g.3299 m.3299 type:complete len:275 (-) comp2727_c0_seq1:226-1050(-)